MRRSSWYVPAALLVAVLLSVAGCAGGTPQPNPSKKPPEGVLSTSNPGFFRLYGYDDPQLVSKYGAACKITNATAGTLCTRCTLTSSLYDDQGNLIASVDDIFQPVYQGSYWFASSTIDTHGLAPARADVAISLVRWGKLAPGSPADVTATGARYVPGDNPSDDSEIQAVLLNKGDTVLPQVKLTGVLLSPDGTPVAANDITLGKVQPDRTSFDIDLDMTYSGYSSVVVTVVPSK